MASELEIRLLGDRPRAFLNGKEPAGLHKRARKLLVCMTLMPDDRSRWDELGFNQRKAKSDLKRILGNDWIDPAEGAFWFHHRPKIDLKDIPRSDDAEAFDYCCERGELLPGDDYTALDWIADERECYHRRLVGITTRLCEHASPAEVEAILDRARRVLSRVEIEEVRRACTPSLTAAAQKLTATERESDDIETILKELESQMGVPDNAQVVAASLRQVVARIDQQATSWQPARKEVLDRASALIHFYRRIYHFDAEWMIWNLANSRMYAGDARGAFDELRPWMADPTTSAGALCIAGLLNLRMGWHDAAHAVFTAALARNTSPEFKVILREKRDVQLTQSRGQNAGDVARTLLLEPAFDALSTGARASVYCNQARSAPRPMESFRLYEKALEIDREAENPHYELNLVRAARLVGKPEVAQQHLTTFEEMLQTKKAISLTYARMTMLAEQIVHTATETGQDSPRTRARLEEADALYQAVVIGRQRTGDIPGVCKALLGRATIAQALGTLHELRRLARTVELLAKRRSGRFEAKAIHLSTRVVAQLEASEIAHLDRLAAEETERIEEYLPRPLTVPSA